jgi:hypothetical protein
MKHAWFSGDASQEMGDIFSFKLSIENLTIFSDTALKDMQNVMPEFDMICCSIDKQLSDGRWRDETAAGG